MRTVQLLRGGLNLFESAKDILKGDRLSSFLPKNDKKPMKAQDASSKSRFYKPAEWPDRSKGPRFKSSDYTKSQGKFAKLPQSAVYGGGLRGMKGSTAKVYWVLLAHRNNKTGIAYPGTKRLAFYAGVSSRDGTEALLVLEAIGAIEIKRNDLKGFLYRIGEPRAIVSMAVDPKPSVKDLRRQLAQLVAENKRRSTVQNELRKLTK